MNEDRQKELCEKIESIGYFAQPDRNGNIYVGESAEQMEQALAEINPVDWEKAPNWADHFEKDGTGKLAWFSKFGYQYVGSAWYRSFTELETWPQHDFKALEPRPTPEEHLEKKRDRESMRDVVVIGGGNYHSMGMAVGGRRVGLGRSGLGLALSMAVLAASCSGVTADPPEQQWLTESDPKKSKGPRKLLSSGERKTRNKKLKSQKNSRRYNRKG